MPDARLLDEVAPPTPPPATALPGSGGPGLSLSVLGPVRAGVGDRVIRLRSRKARALLGYLALCDKAEETRERLVGLLWSESGEEKARASLRQVVHELREALVEAGCRHLRAERLSVGLDCGPLRLDLAEVLREAEGGRVHPLLLDGPRLAESLLEGLDDVDPAFRVWLLARRQAFHDRLMRLLEPRLREEGSAPGGRRQRRRVAEAILRLDPTHEEACRALMAACAAEGDVAAALRAYESLWTLLGDEYDMEPSVATQELVAAIKTGRFEAAPASPAARGFAEPPAAAVAAARSAAVAPARVALLLEPFGVNGVPPDRLHLVQGFRHDLIACLVRFREWFVVDGPSLPPPEQTAARVSGRYRISATAYQAGDRISMVLTLAEQDSGIFVWSERIELSLEGWFEAQQRVMRRIAAALNLQISNARLVRLSAEPDVSLEAYDRWLRGQSMILGFGAEPWRQAVKLLEETVERTPGFAPVHSSLAQLQNTAHIARPGTRRERAREEAALRHARRAVELDPTDSRSHLCLAWALAMADRYTQAEMHLRLALDLNPYDSWTLISAAMVHGFSGEHATAGALAAQSLEMTLAPSRTHWGYHGTIAFLLGDDEAAVESLDRAEDVICTLPAWRAAALAHAGRAAEAEAAAARFVASIRARWHGDGPATDAAITDWLLHQYPLRRAGDWERLCVGIGRAGLPTGGCAHRQWQAPPTG